MKRPSRNTRVTARIVGLESLGFLLVVAAIWLDELFDLPHRFLSAAVTPFRPEEALLESGLVALLAAAVILWTIRVLRRVANLESRIVVCGWCHRVKLDEQWVSLERFLHEHRAETSHGICPTCTSAVLAADESDHPPVSPPA